MPLDATKPERNSCNNPCDACEGMSHHWMPDFEEDESGELINPDDPRYMCKHCPHSVPVGEPDHPNGCDCPDCGEYEM